MACKCEQFFPFYRGKEEQMTLMFESDKAMFKRSTIPGWPARPNDAAKATSSWLKYVVTLPPGEESMILTDRYVLPDPLYRDAPPYIKRSCLYPEKTARGLFDLPAELLDKILKNVGLFEGPVLMALNYVSPNHFRCQVMQPCQRALMWHRAGDTWNISDMWYRNIPRILDMRKVCRLWGDMVLDIFFQNTLVFQPDRRLCRPRSQDSWVISTSKREDRYNLADFRIRFNPVDGYRAKPPPSESDGISFTYEEELVHLGTSCDGRDTVIGTDPPREQLSDMTMINDHLFRDSKGRLVVRAFRLKFGLGTRAVALTAQWASEIFQCLHEGAFASHRDSDNTLLLDWNAQTR